MSAGLWALSWNQYQIVSLRLPSDTRAHLYVVNGNMVLEIIRPLTRFSQDEEIVHQSVRTPNTGYRFWLYSGDRQTIMDFCEDPLCLSVPGWSCDFWGFRYRRGWGIVDYHGLRHPEFDGAFTASGLYVGAPLWLFVLLGLAGTALGFLRWRRHSKAVVQGLCPACGYDLRATPGRCPECGLANGKAD